MAFCLTELNSTKSFLKVATIRFQDPAVSSPPGRQDRQAKLPKQYKSNYLIKGVSYTLTRITLNYCQSEISKATKQRPQSFPPRFFQGRGSLYTGYNKIKLWAIVTRGRATDNVKGSHLSPYSKLRSPLFSSRWLLQDISLFLIEISVLNFLPNKMFMKVPGQHEQDSDPRSGVFSRPKLPFPSPSNACHAGYIAVHHPNHQLTKDLLRRRGLTWKYIASTLTLNRS